MSLSLQSIERDLDRHAVVARLRALMPAREARPAAGPALPFGLAALDGHLPARGLALGALHEFTAPDEGGMPAAFGLVAALLGRALAGRRGQGLLVLSGRGLADFGRPYGHGLAALGLAPERLLLLETASDLQALWALEEALRLNAVAAVAGWLGGRLDLKASRRLQVAAEGSDALLLLLRPPRADAANAAATRWRVSAAPAARDRFGCFAQWRWRLALERCRNGRPGTWIVEWRDAELSDGAHCFGLAGAVADPALARGAGEEPARRAG